MPTFFLVRSLFGRAGEPVLSPSGVSVCFVFFVFEAVGNVLFTMVHCSIFTWHAMRSVHVPSNKDRSEQWRIQDLSHGGGGGGGAWNSKTPKLVIATRSRRGPALAPSRGGEGLPSPPLGGSGACSPGKF